MLKWKHSKNESFKDTLKKLKLTIIPESRNKGSKIPPTNLPISTLLFFNFTQFNSRTSNLFLKTIQSRVLHFSWKSWKPISQNWLKDQSKWKKDWNLMIGCAKRTQKQVRLREFCSSEQFSNTSVFQQLPDRTESCGTRVKVLCTLIVGSGSYVGCCLLCN